jgi:ABC-type branched-subunit amino acid transport system substrate-binding protein
MDRILQSVAIGCVLSISLGGALRAQELSVTIGVPAPITGSQANVGDSMVKGAQLAADQAKGIKVNLDVQDEACDPQAGVNATNKLVANRVAIAVGFFCSGAALPSTAIFHRAHIPLVVVAAVNPAITKQGFPEIFRVIASNEQEGPAAVKFMLDTWKAKSFVVIHDNTAVNKGEADSVANNLGNGGGKVLSETAITPNTTEFGVTVAQIGSLNPEAVFLALYYPEAALIAKQLGAAGYAGKIMASDGGVDPGFIKIAGENVAEKVVFISQPVTSELTTAKPYIDAYKVRYGEEPGPYSVYEYDGINVAIAAVKQAGSTDADKLIAALKAYKGAGTTGTIQFDSSGQLATSGFATLVVRNGEFVLGP